MEPGWWAARARTGAPGRIDPGFLGFYRRTIEPLVRAMHRPTMEGAEQIPRDRPFLLVANHSGGMAFSELFGLVAMYRAHLSDLRVVSLAHPFGFHFFPVNVILRRLGAVPSTHEQARAALAEGAGVLVFPGGDHEVSRPFWEAGKVDFNRRKGFLRLARDAGVPVVPMGISGSHNSCPILWRSTVVLPRLLILPWLFGIKRFPLSLTGAVGLVAIAAAAGPSLGWPAAIGLMWLWMASLLSFLPWVPTTIRYRVGAPIEPEQLFVDDDLERAHDLVRGRVQTLVEGRPPAAEASAPEAAG